MNTMDASAGRRRALRRAASIAIIGGLLGLTPLTATASDDTEGADETAGGVQVLSLDQCSNGFFCLWSNSAYTGTFTQMASTSPVNLGSTVSRSVWNRTGKAVRVYAGTGGTGSSVCFSPTTRSGSVSITSRSAVVQSGTVC